MKKTILSAFVIACLTACNSDTKNEIDIPQGQYILDGKRGFVASMECGMTETTFGKTLIITDGKISTNVLGGETANYTIKKLDDTNYLTNVYRPIAQDTSVLQFSFDATNNELVFLCNETKIVYQKEN